MTVIVADVTDGAAENGPVRYTLVIVVLILLGANAGLLFGYDTGVVSGAMLLIRPEMHLDNLWHEYIVSGTIAAAGVASIIAGFSIDRFGRRPTLLVAATVFTAGSVCMAVSNNKEVLLVGRVVVGIGVGLASMTTPVYLGEVSPPGIRGKVVVLYNVGITFGQFVATIICGLFAEVTSGWRWMLGLAGVPSAVLLLGMLFMPESPRWLAAHGRLDDAERVLRRLRGADVMGDDDEAALQRELQGLQTLQPGKAVEADGGGGRNLLLRVLTTRTSLLALIVASMSHVFAQGMGINTVMYYSASIIQMAGVGSASQAIWLAAGVNAAYVFFGFVGIAAVERAGRRVLMLASTAGTIVALAMLAGGFYIMDTTSAAVTEAVASAGGCASLTTCADCMYSAATCGFCHSTSNATSWCWAAAGEGGDPLDHTCDADAGFAWVVGACPSPYSWIAIAALLLYLASFAPGLGPIPWALNAEIHPMWARGVSGSISASVCWVANLLVSLTFLTLVEALTPKYAFLVYLGVGVLAFVCIFFGQPETKGIRLEDMDSIFDKKPWSKSQTTKRPPRENGQVDSAP